MARRSTRWHARPLLLLLPALVVAMPIPAARAQDRALQDRLDRLERDLSMLQRQVYRGAPPQVISAGSGAAVDVELRMDRLESQMRELTGRIEDAVNGVDQLRRRLEQINSDIDTRFTQDQGLPKGPAPNSRASVGIGDSSPGAVALRGPPPSINPPRTRTADLTPPGTLVLPPPQDRPGGPSTLTPPAPTPSRPEGPTTVTNGNLRPPPAKQLPAGSASEQYNLAFGLLKQADYPAAEEALKGFIRQYPNDPLAGSAQYWLGETYYARSRYAEAAGAFAEGYRSYPKGVKAPDDLLKLGMSLARNNQRQNACVAFAQLDHDFPHAGGAIKDRATAEKKRLGC